MLLEPNRFVWDHNYEIFMKFLQLFAIRQIPGAPPFQIRSIRNKLPRPEEHFHLFYYFPPSLPLGCVHRLLLPIVYLFSLDN